MRWRVNPASRHRRRTARSACRAATDRGADTGRKRAAPSRAAIRVASAFETLRSVIHARPDSRKGLKMTAGEVINALASFAGGLVGAIGAVAAVYLALSAQRKDESTKVSAAVMTEVASLTTYVIGAIRICQGITTGEQRIPARDATYIIRKISAEPVIYTAVADRIGLLPHPNATAQFYMRIAEAKAMVESMRLKAENEAMDQPLLRGALVAADMAGKIADSLITALQLAHGILADDGKVDSATWIRQQMLSQIDECLTSSKASFPNAESFKQPSKEPAR
jgi:hypothetical protein